MVVPGLTRSPTLLASTVLPILARLKAAASSHATLSTPPSVLSSWTIWTISIVMMKCFKRNE